MNVQSNCRWKKRAEAIVVREKEKKKKKRIKTWLILKRNIPRWNILPFPPSPPPPPPVQNLKINSIFCFNTVPNYLRKSFFSRRVSRKFSNYESWKLKVSRHKKRKVFQGRPSISRFPRLRKKKKKEEDKKERKKKTYKNSRLFFDANFLEREISSRLSYQFKKSEGNRPTNWQSWARNDVKTLQKEREAARTRFNELYLFKVAVIDSNSHLEILSQKKGKKKSTTKEWMLKRRNIEEKRNQKKKVAVSEERISKFIPN